MPRPIDGDWAVVALIGLDIKNLGLDLTMPDSRTEVPGSEVTGEYENPDMERRIWGMERKGQCKRKISHYPRDLFLERELLAVS